METLGPPSLRRIGERVVLFSLCLGTAAALMFVALNRLAPLEGPKTMAWAFLEWSLLYYGVTVPVVLIGVWALAWIGARAAPRWRGWSLLPQAVLAVVAVGFLIVCATRNREALGDLLTLSGSFRFRFLSPAAFVLAATGALACAAQPLARPWPPRVLGLLAPLAAAVAFLPEAQASTLVQAPAVRRATTPLLMVGIDGADWDFIDALVARGDLPNLAALRKRGAWGDLETIVPTRSPAIWNTIATGQPPSRHGVEAFTSLRVNGVNGLLKRTRKPHAVGFRMLYDLLERWGEVAQGPVPSSARRVPAFWNLATAAGSPVAVVDWWATWPAEPVLGAMVSERVHFWREAARGTPPEDSALTYPDALQAEIHGLVMSPDDVRWEDSRPFMDVSREEFAEMMARPFKGKTIEGEFKYFYSMFETNRRVSLYALERTQRTFGAPADLLVLFRIVDIASHSSLQDSELVQDHLDASPSDLRRYGRVVSESYRRVDQAIGQLMAASPGANVLVVSDHGFQREETEGGGPVYHHMAGPAGIFLAAGPSLHAGHVAGLTVFDVLPLAAALKGFPVANDLPGHVPEEVLDPQLLRAQPIRRVATYGRRQGPVAAAGGSAADGDALERLRALGYIH